MARIVFSVSSAGLGHASRAVALIPPLAAAHEVKVCANHEALDFMKRALAGQRRAGRITFHKIPTLKYQYRPNGSLDLVRTIGGGYIKLYRRQKIEACEALIERLAPDAVVSDFDPFTAWAAKRAGIPFVYLAAAFYFSRLRLRYDTLGQKEQAQVMAVLTNLTFPRGERLTIVPTFRDAVRPASARRRVERTMSVIHAPLLAAPVETGRHVLAYLGGPYHAALLDHLADLGAPVHVYGLGRKGPVGNLRFFAFHAERYAEHLASCRAILAPGGHQSLSEILFLGKPALVVPQRNHWEQQFNARQFARFRPDSVCQFDEVTPERVRALLERPADGYPRIPAGNEAVLSLLEREIAELAARAVSHRLAS